MYDGANTSKLYRVAVYVVLIVLALIWVGPLVVILSAPATGAGLFENFSAVFLKTPFAQAFVNSAVIAAGTVALTYVLTLLGAFAFAKLHIPLKSILLAAVLVGLMVPPSSLIVPLFITASNVGLLNNYIAVILPLTAVGAPFTILLALGFIREIPDAMLEAARIDGCSTFAILHRIIFPLSGPISAVIVVWSFLQAWNEFFLPLLLMLDTSKQTVTTLPAYFTSYYGSDQPKVFATLILISLPIVIAYLLLQRFFERGLSAGAIK